MNLKTLKLEVLDIKKDVSYGDSRMYKIVDETEGIVLRCRQIPFPNCCGITILENVSISHSVKGAEINAVMDMIIDDLYVNDKYSKLIFYTTNNSKEALAFSEYKGCLILDTFVNRRSLNTLIGFEINIEEKHQNNDEPNVNPIEYEDVAYVDSPEFDSDDFFDIAEVEMTANEALSETIHNEFISKFSPSGNQEESSRKFVDGHPEHQRAMMERFNEVKERLINIEKERLAAKYRQYKETEF